MPEFVIRDAVMGDFDRWRSTYAEVASERRWIGGEEAPPIEAMKPRFESDVEDPDRLMVVADTEADGVVGGLFAAFERRGVAHIGMQMLEPWRGKGVGSALMDRCLAWCGEKNAHKVTLEVWPHNGRAIALYRKFGFEAEGRLKRHYRRQNGELWDAVSMALVLDTTAPGSPYPDELS